MKNTKSFILVKRKIQNLTKWYLWNWKPLVPIKRGLDGSGVKASGQDPWQILKGTLTIRENIFLGGEEGLTLCEFSVPDYLLLTKQVNRGERLTLVYSPQGYYIKIFFSSMNFTFSFNRIDCSGYINKGLHLSLSMLSTILMQCLMENT